MKKQITIGQFISALIVIGGAMIAFAINTSSVNAAQDAQIKALEKTQARTIGILEETNRILYTIDGRLKQQNESK